jgi:hypothetical protein
LRRRVCTPCNAKCVKLGRTEDNFSDAGADLSRTEANLSPANVAFGSNEARFSEFEAPFSAEGPFSTAAKAEKRLNHVLRPRGHASWRRARDGRAAERGLLNAERGHRGAERGFQLAEGSVELAEKGLSFAAPARSANVYGQDR